MTGRGCATPASISPVTGLASILPIERRGSVIDSRRGTRQRGRRAGVIDEGDVMAYPDNLLVTGERVIVNKRPHWKVLILPTILFIVIIGAGAALAGLINSRDIANSTWMYWAIVLVAVIALVTLVVVPFVRWRTEHFVITNHHVFFRTGLLSRREHQIPLGQIANMETEVTFWGRLMGYGSLIVESSADQPLKFRNVASLSKVQATLNQLIRDERERTHRRGNEPDPGPDRAGYQGGGYQGGGYQGGGYQGGGYQGGGYEGGGGYQGGGHEGGGGQQGGYQQAQPPQGFAAPGSRQQPYPTEQYPAQNQYPAQHQYPQGAPPSRGQTQGESRTAPPS